MIKESFNLRIFENWFPNKLVLFSIKINLSRFTKRGLISLTCDGLSVDWAGPQRDHGHPDLAELEGAVRGHAVAGHLAHAVADVEHVV